MKKSILTTLFSLLLLGLAIPSGAVQVATGEISEPPLCATAASSSVSAAPSSLEFPLQPIFASSVGFTLFCEEPCTSRQQCRDFCTNLGFRSGRCTVDFGLDCLNDRDDTYCSCS